MANLMRVIFISFEKLPACALGCYGEWNYSTPYFDVLAESALVCDNYFVSPDLPSLAHQLQALDCRQVPIRIRAPGFPSTSPQGTGIEVASPAQLPDALNRHFASAGDSAQPQLISIQIPVLDPGRTALLAAADAWLQDDAKDFRTLLGAGSAGTADPLDHFHRASALAILPEWKQDLVLATAEVMEYDAALGGILEAIALPMSTNDLLVVTSSSGDLRRGTPGHPDWLKPLSEPVVHLPLLLRTLDDSIGRTSSLIGSNDLVELIASWLQGRCSLEEMLPGPERSEICYACASAQARRSPDWLLIQQIAGENPEDSAVRLFRKPEDVWEVLDVASQYPDLIEEFMKKPGETAFRQGDDLLPAVNA
jgi:hypothetical protein